MYLDFSTIHSTPKEPINQQKFCLEYEACIMQRL